MNSIMLLFKPSGAVYSWRTITTGFQPVVIVIYPRWGYFYNQSILINDNAIQTWRSSTKIARSVNPLGLFL